MTEIDPVIVFLQRLAAQRSPMPASSNSTPALSQSPRVTGKGKTVCPSCKRDIYKAPVEQADGSVELVAFDTEVMTGAEYPKGKKRMFFRRNHAERCGTYQLESERKSKHDRWRRQAGEI